MIIYNLWSTRKPIVQQDKNICWFWRFFPIYLLSFFNLLKKNFQIVSPSLFQGTSFWKLMFFFPSIYLYNPWYSSL